MQLSVIILNYNVRYYLELCLQSVMRAIQGIDTQVIVVDNASTDTSTAMVKDHFPQVELIINTENLGFSTGNNIGVDQAKGEYVCILNPDTVVPEDCFKQLLKFCSASQQKKINLGAVGVRLIDGKATFLPESKRNLPTPGVALRKMLGKDTSYYASRVAEFDVAPVSILVGAFMFIKRSVYLKVGGFDTDYFMYGEDIDLSYRLEKAGFTNYYYGKSTVIHFKGESTTRNEQYLNRFYGAMSLFYNKHFKTNKLRDGLVRLGLSAARLKAKTLPKTQDQINRQELIIYCNDDQLHIQLEEKLGSKIYLHNRDVDQDPVNKQLVFDAGCMSYKAMIKVMQLLKNRQNTYRIRPSNCNFILGSDTSTSNGTVVTFE